MYKYITSYMRLTMCINILRPRPRPFKFEWVSISLYYAKISVFCPASSARFPSSNVVSSCSCQKTLQNCNLRVFLINIFCMCLCTHGFIMVHLSRAFHAVWSATHWWQTRWRPFLFSVLYGVMYREAEFATNIQAVKDL